MASKTGYLPITTAAYELTKQQGFYDKNPGADVATRQMLNKPPLAFTKGVRLGNMPQIRTVVDEELEGVWTGKKTPQQALDEAVLRGNQLLERFENRRSSFWFYLANRLRDEVIGRCLYLVANFEVL